MNIAKSVERILHFFLARDAFSKKRCRDFIRIGHRIAFGAIDGEYVRGLQRICAMFNAYHGGNAMGAGHDGDVGRGPTFADDKAQHMGKIELGKIKRGKSARGTDAGGFHARKISWRNAEQAFGQAAGQCRHILGPGLEIFALHRGKARGQSGT